MSVMKCYLNIRMSIIKCDLNIRMSIIKCDFDIRMSIIKCYVLHSFVHGDDVLLDSWIESHWRSINILNHYLFIY